jgi:hypothetical protein
MNNGRVEPRIMGMGPVPAVRKVLDRGSASGVPGAPRSAADQERLTNASSCLV